MVIGINRRPVATALCGIMAVTMTDRSSAVDGFLRAQRNKLSEEKARMRVRETSRYNDIYDHFELLI